MAVAGQRGETIPCYAVADIPGCLHKGIKSRSEFAVDRAAMSVLPSL